MGMQWTLGTENKHTPLAIRKMGIHTGTLVLCVPAEHPGSLQNFHEQQHLYQHRPKAVSFSLRKYATAHAARIEDRKNNDRIIRTTKKTKEPDFTEGKL